jgi:hypothetical protein
LDALSQEQRRHERHGVRLAVRYTNAAQFVEDYVENLSEGGLFVAGAHEHPLPDENEVEIELPGQGRWRVLARVVFRLDAEAAAKSGRTPGVGFQILGKPAGYDDALLGYLLRLGRRREFAIMVGEVAGARFLAESGYRIVPLVPEGELAAALADDKLLAVVVPPGQVAAYRDKAKEARSGDVVFAVASDIDVADTIARIDSLL